MWWHEPIVATARAHGWPAGDTDAVDVWYVDRGPRFGLFGPARLVVEVRDAASGTLRGSFLFDATRQTLIASRIGPRRFLPVWKLRRWMWQLVYLPVRVVASVLLWLLGGVMRLNENLLCWSLRNAHVSRRKRDRLLADLPPDVRDRVRRRCPDPAPTQR
jgi:hypothetical protein